MSLKALSTKVLKKVAGMGFFHIKEDVMCRERRNEKEKTKREAEKGESCKGVKEHGV